MEFTTKQIDEFKAKQGRIFLFKTGTGENVKSCILRAANRNDLSLANIAAMSGGNDGQPRRFDPQKFNESILLTTWIAGDEEIKSNEELFLGVSDQLDTVIKKAEFEVKEL